MTVEQLNFFFLKVKLKLANITEYILVSVNNLILLEYFCFESENLILIVCKYFCQNNEPLELRMCLTARRT